MKKSDGGKKAKAPEKMPSPRKSVKTESLSKDSSYYRKLAKSQMDSSNQMGAKNNPMGKEVLKRSVANSEKAIRLESKMPSPRKKK